ncbi:MAG: hypothetical protein FJ304_09145, partial [Planctomycetes bacterium]|nr:hypothetical protein [Planctomycetota bacterium]
METNPFKRLRADFVKAPLARWGAVAGSAGSALVYVLLLLVLYLFVDLLVWRGEVPSYAQLPAARKRAFADEWAARPEADRKEAVGRLAWPDAKAARLTAATDDEVKKLARAKETERLFEDEWEARWRAGVYLILRDRVGPRAADVWLPPLAETHAKWDEAKGADAPAEKPDPDARPQYGLLSLVVREHGRWTAGTIGTFAALSPWAWAPGTHATVNVSYLTGLFVLAFALALARGVLVNALAYLSAEVTLDAVARLRRAVYLHSHRLGSLTMQTIGAAGAADLLTKRVEEVEDALRAEETAAVRAPLTVALLLALILLVNFWLAVSFLALAGLVWLIGGQVTAHFRREARLGERQATATGALLRESIGLFRLVKCFQMERFNQTRVERQLAESGRAARRRLRGAALAGP